MKAILLAAERGVRRLQASESYPWALQEIKGRRLIDWLRAALQDVGVGECVVVGGYHIEKLLTKPHNARCLFNPDWENSGEAENLFVAARELAGDCIVSRTDVIYDSEVLRRMLIAQGDIVVAAVLSASGRDVAAADEEGYAGLVRLTAIGAAAVLALRERLLAEGRGEFLRRATIPELLQCLPAGSVAREVIAAGEGWARINDRFNMARFVFGTKSKTLDRLRAQLKGGKILDQVRFSVTEWLRDRENVLDRIQQAFADATLIVRSSASNEDSWEASNAGRYSSRLDVSGGSRSELSDAIDEVVASYRTEGRDFDRDEVFVQRQLDSVDACGVVLARDPATAGLYTVISFDSSGDTTAITSGSSRAYSTCYVFDGRLQHLPPEITALGPVIRELSETIEHDALDIEFAIVRSDCYILQVRPIATSSLAPKGFDLRDALAELGKIGEFLDHSFVPKAGVCGDSTVFANMSDWNPVEIIGSNPRPLATSLYKELIVDHVWAVSRAELGYRSVEAGPLMVVLGGHPYIDTRLSFNSFVPQDIPADLAAKLVNHYLDRLRTEPRLQDKVEFEIAITCGDFSSSALKKLSRNGFDEAEIAVLRNSLMRLTDSLVDGFAALYARESARLEELGRRRDRLRASVPATPIELIDTISALLTDCRQFGTLPFANLARCGFVATQLIRSLEARGVFSTIDCAELNNALPTVATELSSALMDLSSGGLTRAGFLERFGHLRPGTYEILSPSYSERPELYIGNFVTEGEAEGGAPLATAFNERFLYRREDVDRMISEAGFSFDASRLAAFISTSIPAREQAKFEFTRNVDLILVLLRRLGELLELDVEDVSFLPIGAFLDQKGRSLPSSLKSELKRAAGRNRKAYTVWKMLRLPPVISGVEDIHGFTVRDEWPNFVTHKAIVAPIVELDGRSSVRDNLAGRIVAIESADPGYDWIFGCRIAGLVTKYGGIASHMAIRCAEFGLPAAIGCGENIYNRLARASVVELDCINRRASVIR